MTRLKNSHLAKNVIITQLLYTDLDWRYIRLLKYRIRIIIKGVVKIAKLVDLWHEPSDDVGNFDNFCNAEGISLV